MHIRELSVCSKPAFSTPFSLEPKPKVIPSQQTAITASLLLWHLVAPIFPAISKPLGAREKKKKASSIATMQ
jgi:hypothetical protein